MNLWMYGIGINDKKTSLNLLKYKGITNIVTGYDPYTANIAADLEISAYFCQGAYPVPASDDIDRYLSVDINGKKQLWFNSTCPNNKYVREKTLIDTNKWSSEPNTKGVFMDGARFSSPCSGNDIDAFFTCFCQDCMKKAASFGLDPDLMKNDVRKLYILLKEGSNNAFVLRGAADILGLLQHNKGIWDWFMFKKKCTTEFLSQFSQIVRSNKKAAGIFIFTPSLSYLVGQNYCEIEPYMDIISPMIYRAYKETKGPASLNRELAAIARTIRPLAASNDIEVIKMMSSLFGISLCGYKTPAQIDEGLDESIIGHETLKAIGLIGNKKKLAPIILLDDDKLSACINEVEKNGADEIILFKYDKKLLDRDFNS